MTLGQRIQELRKQSNLSQEALGEKLGVSRQAVSRWEMDGAVPEVDKLIAMGRLFGVDLNDLLQVAQPGPAGEREAPDPVPEGEGEAPGPTQEGDGPLHPVNWWKWLPPILALLALVLGLVALTLSFGRITGKLSDRLTALESRVEELESRPDPSVPLVADAQVSSRWYSYAQGIQGSTITVSLTPGELREDLELTLSYVRDSDGYSREHEFTREAGGTYRTSFFSAGGDCPFTLTALISTGGRTYTQPLFRVFSVEAGTILYDELWRETAS